MGDGITLIDEPHIRRSTAATAGISGAGTSDMLVDSGMGVVSLRDWVPLVTEQPLLAVASHTHFDHIGCHHEFPRRAVHRAEAHLLAQPTRKAVLADPYVTDEIFDHAAARALHLGRPTQVQPAPATQLLEDGDILPLGPRRFEVIHTPGHSPGGIALWEAATGVLISGDIVYDGPLIEDTYHSDAADYRALDAPPARPAGPGGAWRAFSHASAASDCAR